MPVTQVSGDTGNGATLTFASTSFAVLVKKISGWEETIEKLDVTNLASTGRKRYISSDLKEPPEITYDFYWDTTKDMPTIGGAPETITVTFPVRANGGETNGATYAGTGFIKSIKWPDLENGSVQMGSLTVCYDGTTGPTYSKAT